MKKYILTLILALASLGLYAQTNRNKTIINAALHGWEYEIKAGVNISHCWHSRKSSNSNKFVHKFFIQPPV